MRWNVNLEDFIKMVRLTLEQAMYMIYIIVVQLDFVPLKFQIEQKLSQNIKDTHNTRSLRSSTELLVPYRKYSAGLPWY